MTSKNFGQLTFDELRFLLAVERTGNLSKAGEVMNLSPSTSSRTLQSIQSKLGEKCFVYTSKELVGTEYFSKIKPTIEQLLLLSEDLLPSGFSPRTCRRCFRISCMMAEVSHIMGGIIPRFLKEAPLARIHLEHNDNEFEKVMSGAVDFAIVTRVALPPEIHYLDLYPIDRVVLFRKGHPLSKLGRPLRSYDLQLFDRVSISTGRHNHWTSPDQNVFPFEKFRERTRFSTTRFNTAWEAIEKTDLIAICGYRAAEIGVRANKLDFLPLTDEIVQPNIWNSLIWGERVHNDDGCIWLRRIFSEWGREETERVKRKLERISYQH